MSHISIKYGLKSDKCEREMTSTLLDVSVANRTNVRSAVVHRHHDGW